jgi:cyclic pyranopterin phosphate synthase
MLLVDKFGRAITDLRISITDRCNYKCVYCRSGNEGAIYEDLPFSEYLRIVRLFAGVGIKKVRITGGEPLLRKVSLSSCGSCRGCAPWRANL